MTRWVPRFVWTEGAETIDESLLLPVGLWRHAGPPVVGGDIESDAGQPASFVVRRTRTLSIPIRFYESEWPTVRRLVQFAQGDVSFAWHPDPDDVRVYDLYLESPAVGEDIAPEPDGVYPRAMSITITVRQVDDSAFDGLEYFTEPAP